MKYLLLILLLCGCRTKHPNQSVSITTRTLGLDISQGPNGLYHLKLGFITFQWHQIPTGTNEIFAAPMYSSVDVNSKGLSTDIAEEFATGQGVKAIDNSTHASPAKLGAQRPKK